MDPTKPGGGGSNFGPYGALLGGLAGTGLNLWSTMQASDARLKAGMETLRREKAESDQVLGEGRLAEGASGVLVGQSSMATHLDGLTEAFRRAHQWTWRQNMAGTGLANQAAMLGAAASVGSSLFRFGQSQNWWQKPATGGTT